MVEQKTLEFRTRGRGTTDIAAEVQRAVAASGIAKGLCTVFLQHTSASLILGDGDGRSEMAQADYSYPRNSSNRISRRS